MPTDEPVNATGSDPLVSIVIVTYGTGTIILDTLDAIAANTPVRHEVIVVDNPPSDGRPRTAALLVDRSDITRHRDRDEPRVRRRERGRRAAGDG